MRAIVIVIIILFASVAIAPNSFTFGQTQNNTVLEKAQKSLEANQKKLPTVSPEPVPNEVQPAVQEIQVTSMVDGVFFTWVIISSDNEVSINLRYVGDGSSTPPVSLTATAITKNVRMNGNSVLNAGWTSPNSVTITLNGESSLYDSTSINVVASPILARWSTKQRFQR